MSEADETGINDLLEEFEAPPEEAAQIRAAMTILPGWTEEEPPLGLVERTLRAVEEAQTEESPRGLLAWIDHWIGRMVRFFEGQRPLATGLATIVVGTFLLIAVMTPNLFRSHAKGEAVSCKVNQKNIATALGNYAEDHQGALPRSLDQLVPEYMKELPQCPVAEADTYSPGTLLESESGRFTVVCKGRHHANSEMPEDYPQYSSEVGPLEKP